MSDELAAFIAAYRAENRGAALDAGAVRARVLEATWLRRRRRLRRVAWLLPIAAVLVGSGALAASAPAREVVSRVFAALGGASPARAAPVPAPRSRLVRSSVAKLDLGAVAAAPSPSSAPIPPAALEPTVDRRSARSSTAAPRRSVPPVSKGVSGADAAAPSTPVTVETREAPVVLVAPDLARADRLAADIASYRAAHELHFVHADYGRALAAWNSYLGRFPRGTFAPEARLNRAVCLARLGHAEQALSVLRALVESDDAYTRAKALGLRAALAGAGSSRARD